MINEGWSVAIITKHEILHRGHFGDGNLSYSSTGSLSQSISVYMIANFNFSKASYRPRYDIINNPRSRIFDYRNDNEIAIEDTTKQHQN